MSDLLKRLQHVLEQPDTLATLKRTIDEKMESWLEAKTKQLAPSRFQCALCHKLFKASHFVHKHLGLRHADETAKAREGVTEKMFRQSCENSITESDLMTDPNRAVFPLADVEESDLVPTGMTIAVDLPNSRSRGRDSPERDDRWVDLDAVNDSKTELDYGF
eukprot:c18824_g1_i2.p1 GENE.c18824_g1_i2~~c18824_g1_i2.p1  ORF type:complete len:162 (-),score=36.25 c18824_g1_i2:41-526(-)